MAIEYSAKFILSVSENEPERIFPNNEKESTKIYRELMKFWHPDLNKDVDSNKVSSHLSKLYEIVSNKIKSNTWNSPNTLVFHCIDNKERQIIYKKKRDFELGTMAYGDRVLCYSIRSDAKDLFYKSIEVMKKSFTFKDDKMKNEMTKYLPSILENFETKDGRYVVVMLKSPDVFLLQDILDYYGGSLDPKHVAWILSSFYNISCYLKIIGLCHNAISTTNCFISPQYHGGMLFGGWWYSEFVDKRIKALPRKSVSVCPPDILSDKTANHKLDLVLIRQLGLDCLGDPSGNNLLSRKDVPKPFLHFLKSSTSGDAIKDYGYWQKEVLIQSFGKRRFVEMNVSSKDIFGM